MNYVLLVFFLALAASCSTTDFRVNESMLPNGNWVFSAYSENSCEHLLKGKKRTTLMDMLASDNSQQDTKFKEKCIDVFKSTLARRSVELCGHENFVLYGCLNSEFNSIESNLKIENYADDNYKLKCYLRCN